jgi:RIO kinase 1
MRVPASLESLTDMGVIQSVIRPLMSGKEADVYVVTSGGETRVAKVYKEAQNRTFKHRAEYTEGRATRNSRDQRAMRKRTAHGRAQDEATWRSTEVDMIYRLRNAGVRVPTPHHFIDGVLIMEMVSTEDGHPAPRLAELDLERDEAIELFHKLLAEVVRMLCAGVVHGDLSEYNVLLGRDGPVVIDFPQSVDAASNQNARNLLLRDVENIQRFIAQFVADWRPRPYGQELWELYRRNELTPETRITGRFRAAETRVTTNEVVSLIRDADRDERRRRDALAPASRPRGAPPPASDRRGPPNDRRDAAPPRAPSATGDHRGSSNDRRDGHPPRAPSSPASPPERRNDERRNDERRPPHPRGPRRR